MTALARTEETRNRDEVAFEREVCRRTAEQVEQKLALWADAEELACAGSWEYDIGTGSLMWSPGMYRIRGRVPGVLPLTLESATREVHPDDRVRVAGEYGHADPADDEARSTHRIVRGDGSVRDLETRSRVARDVDGVAVRVMGVNVDVTDRIRAEARLQEAQEVGGFGSWEWDITSGSIKWSDVLCRLYGVESGAQRSFEDFLALVHPGDRDLMRSTVRRAGETLEPYSVEHRIVRGDGGIRVLHARGEVITDEAGRPVRMLGTGQDVTERKAIEDARGRMAALVDSSEDAIIAATPDGVIETWNRGAQRLYGYTAEEAVGESVAMLVPPGRADEVKKVLPQIKRGESSEPVETVRLAKDGRPVDVSVRISLVHDAQGELVGVSSITRAITGQKLIEARLRSNRWRRASPGPTRVVGDVKGQVGLVHAVHRQEQDMLCPAVFGVAAPEHHPAPLPAGDRALVGEPRPARSRWLQREGRWPRRRRTTESVGLRGMLTCFLSGRTRCYPIGL